MTSSEPRATEPAPPAAAGPGTWVGDELRRAFETMGQMQRELERLRASMAVQSEQVTTLRDSVLTVEGRTRRHESGQESTRELQQEIALLEEQLEAEASLRRDLAEHVQRSDGRENELEAELRRALEVIARRLDDFEGTQAAVAEQQQRIASGVAEQTQVDAELEGRLDGVEQRVEARQVQRDHTGEAMVRLEATVAALRSGLDAIEQRIAAMQVDQRRLDEELAQVRAIRDREAELLDVLEQQRASRAHTETRLAAIEEDFEAFRRSLASAQEERQVLQREQGGSEERLRALGERVEAQRLVMIEHLRRELRAGEESGRRRIDEIERELRVARGLLLRLTEESAEASALEEQPL